MLGLQTTYIIGSVKGSVNLISNINVVRFIDKTIKGLQLNADDDFRYILRVYIMLFNDLQGTPYAHMICRSAGVESMPNA